MVKTINSNCYIFAAKANLLEEFASCLDAVTNIISEIDAISADHEYFQDSGDEIGHICIRVSTRIPVDQILDEFENWTDWFVKNVSPEKHGFFILIPA